MPLCDPGKAPTARPEREPRPLLCPLWAGAQCDTLQASALPALAQPCLPPLPVSVTDQTAEPGESPPGWLAVGPPVCDQVLNACRGHCPSAAPPLGVCETTSWYFHEHLWHVGVSNKAGLV